MMDKFDHIFINPSDFYKSLDFYKNTLGWKLVSSWGEEDEERGAILKSDGDVSVVLAEEHDAKDNAVKANQNINQQFIFILKMSTSDSRAFPLVNM